jgi:predicted RNA-binding protein with PUA-like domain
MATHYWLLKSEPDTYSIDRFSQEKSTAWNGVRNYQARNFLRDMKKGDLFLFYHSNDDRAVVGVGRCQKEAYPEPVEDEPKASWVQVDVEYVRALKSPVTLSTIKNSPSLKDLLLVKQSRLSVMPIPQAAFEEILNLGSVNTTPSSLETSSRKKGSSKK